MNTESTNKCRKFSLSTFIASGFGTGWAPKAPGTVGSLVAWLLALFLFSSNVGESFLVRSIYLMALSIFGHIATTEALKTTENKDPQWIVIDEWVGVTLALLPVSFTTLYEPLVALVLFRFFDITKLGPIGLAEKLPGAMGVMLDDLVAGLFAGLGVICLGLL